MKRRFTLLSGFAIGVALFYRGTYLTGRGNSRERNLRSREGAFGSGCLFSGYRGLGTRRDANHGPVAPACPAPDPSRRPPASWSNWAMVINSSSTSVAGCSRADRGAMKIPYDFLDKVFIGHLHVDHYGRSAHFLARWYDYEPPYPAAHLGTERWQTRVRYHSTPWIGCRRCIPGILALARGVIDFRGGKLEVHEFPFDGINEVIYDENGVVDPQYSSDSRPGWRGELHPGVERT